MDFLVQAIFDLANLPAMIFQAEEFFLTSCRCVNYFFVDIKFHCVPIKFFLI